MKKRGGKQALTLSQQLLFLQANPVVGGAGIVRAHKLTWHTSIQPTALARQYQVSITYLIGKTPAVQIDEPDLEVLAEGRPLPHIYMDPLRLCLHLPGSEDWDAAKRIDQTIVPWTYTWLFYFEDWLATDDWKGGGRHPGEEPEEPVNRAVRRALKRSCER